MDKRQKTIVWLFILIFLVILFSAAGTYAYLTMRDYKKIGNFGIEINTKGVDTFVFHSTSPVNIEATANNFSRVFGHDLKAETSIITELNTTNASAKYCYELNIILPDEEIFTYSKENTPELILNVSKSTNGISYEKVISNMDITTKTGVVKVPINLNADTYINELVCTKNETKKDTWKMEVTLKWFNDTDQEINNNKKYNAILEANRVEC